MPFAVSFCTIVAVIPTVATPPRYVARGLLYNNMPMFGASINDAGVVVAMTQPGQAVRYDPNGSITAITGPTGATATWVSTIKNDGTLVGAATIGGISRGWIRTSSGQDIVVNPVAGDDRFSFADYVNGIAIGNSSNSSRSRPVKWSLASGPQLLPLLSALPNNSVLAMNSSGLMGGQAETSFGIQPAMWSPSGTVTALPVTTPWQGTVGGVRGINSHGTLVGWGNGGGGVRALRWSSTGALTTLGSFTFFSSLRANAINDAGLVVGAGGTSSSGERAVMWDQAGTPTYFDDLIVSAPPGIYGSHDILGINASGAVVGYGSFGGRWSSFVAVPVPEPASLLVLAAGAFLLRRRKH